MLELSEHTVFVSYIWFGTNEEEKRKYEQKILSNSKCRAGVALVKFAMPKIVHKVPFKEKLIASYETEGALI